jgi:hypothetical protein
MDVQSAIENRGTTYHFSDKEVSEEIVVNLGSCRRRYKRIRIYNSYRQIRKRTA